MAGSTIGFAGMRVDVMTLLCILLFIGAMGKSAQLGLHTWLPDAMEGPTPVSALIHAATMVTAGVFMVCRLSPMFETSETALAVVTYVGAATAIFAATVGTAQTDIKRVIAYSTCSQLGYMFFAAGVGAYGAAMFHLFTHAFFKALLFLGAGSVIHAMHHEQDMRYYGDLRKRIPITFWVMVIGTLAITGVGIVGRRRASPASGRRTRSSKAPGPAARCPGTIAFWVGAFAALLTSFYSWRLIFLTFFGKARWIESEHIQHAVTRRPKQAGKDTTGGYHPHESPLTMLVPLGPARARRDLRGAAVPPRLPRVRRLLERQHRLRRASCPRHARGAVVGERSATIVMVVGLAIAWNNYIRRPEAAGAFVAMFPAVHRFVLNKWYFDEIYDVDLRPPGAVARPLVLASRRRADDRPLRPAWRGLCGGSG